jgi:polyphosphate glucokinase
MSTKSSGSGKRNRLASRKARADPAVASLIEDALAGAPSGESVLVTRCGRHFRADPGQRAIRNSVVFIWTDPLTPGQMVARVKKLAGDWRYDVVSIGYPGPVLHGRPTAEPVNLRHGSLADNAINREPHGIMALKDPCS